MRISLTFRLVATFLTGGGEAGAPARIWGQGAAGKARADARPAVSGDAAAARRLLAAFGAENRGGGGGATGFAWEAAYGRGSDVLHLARAPPERRVLFLGDDGAENAEARARLDGAGGGYEVVEAPPPPLLPSGLPLALEGAGAPPPPAAGRSWSWRRRRRVCLRDADALHTEVEGARAIALYLDGCR